MAKTSAKTNPPRMIAVRTNPFAVMTAAKLPEAPKERTNYGWEEMTRVKHMKRLPASYIDNARSSLASYKKVRIDKFETARAEAEAKGEDALKMFNDNTPLPPDFVTQQARDNMGKLLKHKKGGTEFEFVPYDSEDGEDLAKDQRGNEVAAFYDIIRIQ